MLRKKLVWIEEICWVKHQKLYVAYMRHKKSTVKSITSNQLKWYDFILCYFSTKGFTLHQISKQRKEGHLDGHTRSSLYILTAKIASVASMGFGGKQVRLRTVSLFVNSLADELPKSWSKVWADQWVLVLLSTLNLTILMCRISVVKSVKTGIH